MIPHLGRDVVGRMILRLVAIQIQMILLSFQLASTVLATINYMLLRALRKPLVITPLRAYGWLHVATDLQKNT